MGGFLPLTTRQRKQRLLRKRCMPDVLKLREFLHNSRYRWAGSVVLATIFFLSQSLLHSATSQAFSPLAFPAPHQNVVTKKNKFIIPIAVFGKDQRKPLPKRYKNLERQIGLLHNSVTNTLCTAFCVGSDMIATASHCLFSNRKKRKLHLSSFLFKLKTGKKRKAHYSKLAGYGSEQTRRYIITGTSKLNRKPPIGAARDWAVVRLKRPSCKNGWLKSAPLPHKKLKTVARKKDLFQVAFHMDFRNWQIAYSRSCSVNRNFGGLTWRNIKKHFSAPKSLILHRCDTGEASSGSPLLMDSANGPVVVGINVGTYQQREIIVKNGRIIRRTKYKTIANTAVSSAAFSRKIDLLKQAKVIRGRSDMKSLQSDLKERGYYHGAIDGLYGNRTELAIKAYERRNSRPITGLATHAILAELLKESTNPVSIETSAGYEAQSGSHSAMR